MSEGKQKSIKLKVVKQNSFYKIWLKKGILNSTVVRCSTKKVFLKISQNSQEHTYPIYLTHYQCYSSDNPLETK